jgi:Spy/CpxP family protein refolding chaperone
MQNRLKWLIAALAMTGVAGAVCAQTATTDNATTTSTPSAPAAGEPWHHHRGMGGGDMLVHALHELNLSDAQQQSVHSILANARTQFQAQRQTEGTPNFAALANPGDPNHAAALQDLQSRMTARIQARDQVAQQIYGVLTADQKSQLASILAAKQAKMAQHSPAG